MGSDGDDGSSHQPSSQPIKSKSKRISKNDTDEYWADFGKRHPEQWKELHYIRETIAGKEVELKWWRLKLK